MGIIVKQSIQGSIWSYLGVLVGFVTTSYLYTEYLTPEIVGLFGLLMAITTLTSQFAMLGMSGVTARLFPYFRDPGKGHHGFLFIAVNVQLAGFLLFLAGYYIFRDLLIETNLEKSRLFAEYVHLLVPLTFFMLIFSFLDSYNRVLYNVVLGTFLQEFLQRVFIFSIVILYALKLLTLEQLILAYAAAVSLKSLIILICLFFKKEINLRPDLQFIDKNLRKEITGVALFSVLGGMGSLIIFNIDKIVVNQMLNLANTGVYTIAFYFGTLVVIPSRPLLKISGTLIADAWARDDLGTIRSIYYKSCINQFIIGGFLFLGIWANIDNILTILGDDYLASKWVIFFIGLGYLFDMLTGANIQIIAFSKYYRISLLFMVILIAAVIAFLFLFIKLWGITGAALAIAGALLINNLMRYLFLYVKFRLQPFNIRFLFVAAFFTGVYLLLELIPPQPLIPDILIRGTLISLLTGLFLLKVPVSDDIKMLIEKIRSQLRLKKTEKKS